MSGASILGEAVRQRMQQLGLTRGGLAAMTGLSRERVDQMAIAGWAQHAMTLGEAAEIARALELPLEDLGDAAMADRKARP